MANNKEDIFIGRGSALGNPYTGSKELSLTKALYQCETREESIELYEVYLKEQIASGNQEICDMIDLIIEKSKKGNVNLVCYCKPLDCHGDVIKKIATAKILKQQLIKRNEREAD